MTRSVALIFVLLAVGCSSQPVQQPTSSATRPHEMYTAQAASALVYDLPLAAHQPPLDLSRDDRQPSAFVGYETGVATYFYLRADDRQSDTQGDSVERRNYTTRTGISYR